jgi:hypothetical protein
MKAIVASLSLLVLLFVLALAGKALAQTLYVCSSFEGCNFEQCIPAEAVCQGVTYPYEKTLTMTVNTCISAGVQPCSMNQYLPYCNETGYNGINMGVCVGDGCNFYSSVDQCVRNP